MVEVAVRSPAGPAFIGRSGELAVLSRLGVHDGDERATAAAAVVIGEPGSGKSRLLAEAATRSPLRSLPPTVGYETAQTVPLAAAADLLRGLTRVPDEGDLLDHALHHAGELEPLRVFEAAYRCVRRLGPVLLAVDDLQWADDQSIALCQHLLRGTRSEAGHMVLVACARPCSGAGSFADSLRRMLGPDLVEMELGPLSSDDAVRLALAVAPQLGVERAAGISARAGGSPFWVEVLARSGGEEADAARLIRARLRGLPPDVVGVVELAAVAARPVVTTNLAVVLGWDEARVDHAATELVNRGLVVRAGAALSLAHDLVRAAVVADVPAAEQGRLHRLLALRLEATAEGDLPSLLEALEHRRAGGLPVLELASRLVRSRQRRLLGAEGLERLAAIADEADPADPDALALQTEVAALASELGEREVALARWSHLGERLRASVDRARAALEASKAATDLQRSDEALSLLARARSYSGDDALLGVEVDAHESQVLRWLENRRDDARPLSCRAIEAAERMVADAGGVDVLDPPGRTAYLAALRAAFDAAVRDEELDDALRVADRMIVVARPLGDMVERVELDVAFSLSMVGRDREAAARVHRAWVEARRRVLPRVLPEATFQLAQFRYDEGRLAEAAALGREAVALAERLGPPSRYSVGEVRCFPHLLELSLGDRQAAFAGLEREVAAEPDVHARMTTYMSLVRWLARIGGASEAARVPGVVARGMADADAAGCERCRGEFIVVAAEALARVGAVEAARGLLAGWDAAHPAPHPLERLHRLSAAAPLAAHGRDAAATAAAFDAWLGEARAGGHRMEELWALLDIGSGLGPSDRERATRTLEEAAALAEEIGAVNQRADAAQRLRALGVRTWRRAAGAAERRLSEREAEVADLVVRGATNAEIASRLFLSPKTVERHVSNILTKVGARNRTDLARRLGAGGEAGARPEDEGFSR